jgi:WD40 repeat protein
MYTSSAIRLSNWTLPLTAALILLAPPAAIGRSPDMRFRPTALLPVSGQFIAQDAWNGVALYRLADLSLVYSFRAGAAVGAFAVTPDEGTLLLGCNDGSLSAWDLSTGQKLWTVAASRNGPGIVYDVCCSRDGRSVVVDWNGQAMTFAVATGRQLSTVWFPQEHVMSAALSPDGSRGVLVTLGEKLIAFDVATGQTQDTGIQGAWPVRYSTDGKYIALRSDNDWGLHLRVVRTDGWAVQDFASSRKPDPILPTADGGFLVTTWAGNDTVGVRWRSGAMDLEEAWRFQRGYVYPDRMSFDPKALVGVRTTHSLVTEVVDLKTGAVLGSIDNHANNNRQQSWFDTIAAISLGGFVASWVALRTRSVVRSFRSAQKSSISEPIPARPGVSSSSICVRLPDR